MNMTYGYPTSGEYNQTIVTFDDGRQFVVNTQYGIVKPIGTHREGCAQVVRMGGICDCGLLDGIDVSALVVDARANGLFGFPPAPTKPASANPVSPSSFRGVCPRCETYCYGDCGVGK